MDMLLQQSDENTPTCIECDSEATHTVDGMYACNRCKAIVAHLVRDAYEDPAIIIALDNVALV
jgi:hypothetical protein